MGINCIICRNKINPRDNNAFSTPCGHIYHKQCIQIYLYDIPNCPTCGLFCHIQQLFQLFTNLNDGDEEDEQSDIKNQNQILLQEISMITKEIKIKDSKFEHLSKMVGNLSENIDGFQRINLDLEIENFHLEESFRSVRIDYSELNFVKEPLTNSLCYFRGIQ